MRPTIEALHQRLADGLPQATITVEDESHLHAGHAGAAGGAGHFKVRIVSARFEGMNKVARHRLVYHLVQDWIPHGIHALTIDARSPAELSA